MQQKRIVLLVLFSLVLSGTIVLGQVTTGTILGTVTDASGGVVPGSSITIRNVETGISRTLTTDAAGRYVAPQLPLGRYEVRAEAAGFQTITRSGIEITVGRQAAVDFSMRVGAVAEQVTVVGEAPLIEATTSSLSGLVNQAQMRDLPLNARSYEQLALLQPTVFAYRNTTQSTVNGYAPKISAAGMRTGYNAYVVDGIDILDTSGQTPGSAAGQLLGVETLREFRVLTNNYPAQHGNALGAVIEVASRGGENQFHGTLFEFLRNDKMDARGFFDSQKPPFKRNQFGGVLGGPIIKDRAFFFGSYEALRERLTTTQTVFVPSADARRGIIPGRAPIEVNSAVVPYLALYPIPQRDLGNGQGSFGYLFNGTVREDFFTGRADYQRSEKVSYFGRYSFDDTDKAQLAGSLALPPWAQTLVSRNQTIVLAETRIFNPQLINEFRAGFVRSTPRTLLALTGPDPELRFPNTAGAGVVVFATGFGAAASSVASLGPTGRPFENFTGNTYQVTDNLSYVKGAHAMKMGFNMERFQDNVENRTETGFYRDSGSGTNTQGGVVTFDSIEQLLAGTPRRFSGPIISAPAGISGRVWLFAFYLQDDWHVRRNLTLNLGLRYEFDTPYADNNRSFIVLNDLFGEAKTRQKEGWSGRTCAGCVDPRFGFAWDVFSNGKTALKGGFGIFRNQLLHNNGYYQIPRSNPGGLYLNADYPSFPDPNVANLQDTRSRRTYTPTGTSQGGVNLLPELPHTPSAMHWNLTLDQQITSNTTVRLSYLGSHGYHLDSGYPGNTNKYTDSPDGTRVFVSGNNRIRTDFASVDYAAFDFNSYYNAFTVTFARRMTRGLGFEASYAFSRGTDDTSLGVRWRVNSASEMRLPDGRRNTYRGLSAFDMRNRFVSNLTYDIPSLVTANGFVSKLFNGWQVNSILTLQAGNPITAWIGFDRANTLASNASEQQRPDLNPAFSGEKICPCTLPDSLGGGVQKSPERYFNPTIFSLPRQFTYGNAGRNTLIGPGLANVDVNLVKNTALTERLNLQFRAEGYNLFNRVNWLQPSTRMFETNGTYSGGAGRIVGTSTMSRQFQFALKLVF